MWELRKRYGSPRRGHAGRGSDLRARGEQGRGAGGQRPRRSGAAQATRTRLRRLSSCDWTVSAAVPVSARRSKSTLQRRWRCWVRQTEAGEAKEQVSATSGMVMGDLMHVSQHPNTTVRLSPRAGERREAQRVDSAVHPGKGRLRATEGLSGGQDGTTNPMMQRDQASARQHGIGGRCEEEPRGVCGRGRVG